MMTNTDYKQIMNALSVQWKFFWTRPVSSGRIDQLNALDSVIAGLAMSFEDSDENFDAEAFINTIKTITGE